MAFFNDDDRRFAGPAAGSFMGLPDAPPGLSGGPQGLPATKAAPVASSLPAAPPSAQKRASLFDKDHRQQTLLTIGASLLGSRDFGQGLGNAAAALAGQAAELRRPDQVTLGGPDDAFEIHTNRETGEQTYMPVKAIQDYAESRRTKAKDTADLNGRAIYAISQMDPKDQPAAFAELKANPQLYGVDAASLPDQWSSLYGNLAGNIGMTVAQAQTRRQAATNAANLEEHRDAADADRTKRTQIYGDRSAAATAQGAQRIGIAQGALGLRKETAGRTAAKAKTPASKVSAMSTADLLALLK